MAGVDTILQKTQEDLGRIKKTSYYQRKQKAETPTPGEEVKSIATAAGTVAASPGSAGNKVKWIGFDSEGAHQEHSLREGSEADEHERDAAAESHELTEESAVEKALEEEKEEEEEENDDDLFNTEYVDVVTSGELKLAYIPDSPTLEGADGDDPFDTSAVEKTVGPLPVIKKKKALVSIGAAVEILTAANAADPPSNRRNRTRAVQPPTEIQLLCCFDGEDEQKGRSSASASACVSQAATPSIKPTPSAGGSTLPTPRQEIPPLAPVTPDIKDILAEFDAIPENGDIVEELIEKPVAVSPAPPQQPAKPQLPLDEEDFEFEALAYESLAKHPHLADPVEEDDPFDTSAVDQVLKKEPTPVDSGVINARAKKGGVPPPARPTAPPSRPTRPTAPPSRPPVPQQQENSTAPPLQAQDSFDALFLNDSPTGSVPPAVTNEPVPAVIQPPELVDELPVAEDEPDPFDTSVAERVISSAAAVVNVTVTAIEPTALVLPAIPVSFPVQDFEDQPEEDDPFDTSAVEKILN